MPLTQLINPFPVFVDLDGSPLDNGYLYFGTVDQNPETNPITVYYDPALTQQASQPLRTTNGFITRNGSPTSIYANSTFSVTVRNNRSALVLYSPNAIGGQVAQNAADIAANTAAIAANGVSIAANAAAIAALGTAATQDFTDNDDLSIDPENVGTRGNVAAAIAVATAVQPADVVLARVDLAGQTQITFDGLDDYTAEFASFTIETDQLKSTAPGEITLQISEDGGATYRGNGYADRNLITGTFSLPKVNISLYTVNVSNGHSFSAKLCGIGSGDYFNLVSSGIYQSATAAPVRALISGAAYTSTALTTGFQISNANSVIFGPGSMRVIGHRR